MGKTGGCRHYAIAESIISERMRFEQSFPWQCQENSELKIGQHSFALQSYIPKLSK
jgi:hypothetical protein